MGGSIPGYLYSVPPYSIQTTYLAYQKWPKSSIKKQAKYAIIQKK